MAGDKSQQVKVISPTGIPINCFAKSDRQESIFNLSTPITIRTPRIMIPPRERPKPRPLPEALDAENVDPETWRQVKLLAWKVDGGACDVSLLRPLWWIEQTGAQVGRLIMYRMPEMGVVGAAKVLSISPCPPIRPGAGGIVTGKFKHAADFVLHIYFEGLEKPLGVTPNHPRYSFDRGEYVDAGKLRIGERLKTRTGVMARVGKIERVTGVQFVYNLEVHRIHRYFVTKLGIMAHNSYEVTKAQEMAIDDYLRAKGEDPVVNPGEAAGGGDRLINGEATEYKTISGVQNTSPESLSGAVANRAMNARSQAPNVVIDTTGQAGMTEADAVRGALRAFGADKAIAAKTGTAPKLASIRLIFINSSGVAADQLLTPSS